MKSINSLPPEQQAIRDKCFHPTGTFVEFEKEEIEQSIPERFEEQVRKYPDRMAVKTRKEELTYDDLNRAANRSARTILDRSAEGTETVAISMEKCAGLIVGILGALKAGKACVNVDPYLPATRISHILEDSNAGLLMTNSKNLSWAKELFRGKPLVINTQGDSSLSPENLGLAIPPENPSLISFTSGSTGQPKGIVHSHRSYLRVIRNTINAFHVCKEDRLSFLASSGGDIYRALLCGASVYPIDIKEQGFVGLADWLIQSEITIYHSVATAFRRFVETLNGAETFPHVRMVILHGESVSKADFELYRKHFSSNCIFVNSLGGNETGSYAHYFVGQDTSLANNYVPVGYAVEDVEVVLLNDFGEKIGIDEIGEITVKSRYFPLGYLNNPELTATAYETDPLQDGLRIYRTGNLGSREPNGPLMCLGRKDNQAKIRGNKVEMEGIEMALLGLDFIREAAVIAREDIPGYKRLVAYIVPASQGVPTTGKLRSILAGELPDFMIPSAFVVLEALPLTGIGKVDRQALPTPSNEPSLTGAPYLEPSSRNECMLANLWQKTLNIQRVSVFDNFFDLGGDSLQAMQVISEFHKTAGSRIRPSQMATQTLAQLSNQEPQRFPWANILQKLAYAFKGS